MPSLGRGEGFEPVLGDVDPDGAKDAAHVFFPSPVLVVRASMLEYPFRTLGRTVATKLPYGPLRPATSRSDHRPLLSARSSSLRSLPRALNSPGLPRDPVLQIKRTYPRMEETSDPPVSEPGAGVGQACVHTPAPAPPGGSLSCKGPCGKAVGPMRRPVPLILAGAAGR